jgi:plasmid stabilization system protein ParE
MHNIKYSNLALIDLENAISHIAKESKTNALSYLLRYEEKIELLKLNPFMGIECKNKQIKKECRILVHESHIIVYKINTHINEIFIIRIFHGSEDYTNKFDRE